MTNDFPPRAGGHPALPARAGRPAAGGGARRLRARVAGGGGVRRGPALTRCTGTPPPDGARAVRRRAGRRARPGARRGHRLVRRGCAAGAAGAVAASPGRGRAGGGEHHGHEVGWSMLPAARQALRRIGRDADVVTTVSRYTRAPVRLGVRRDGRARTVAPGVDSRRVPARPGRPGRAAPPLRTRGRTGGHLRVAASGPQGPGHAHPCAAVGAGPRARDAAAAGGRRVLRGQAARAGGGPRGRGAVVFTGPVPAAELPAHHAVGDVFSLPCRTRGRGLDVEGLGIVAAGGGRFRAAGGRGPTPAARRRPCGRAGPGTSSAAATPPPWPTRWSDCSPIPTVRRRFGAAGRDWMRTAWHWEGCAARLEALLRSGADQAGCFLRPE